MCLFLGAPFSLEYHYYDINALFAPVDTEVFYMAIFIFWEKLWLTVWNLWNIVVPTKHVYIYLICFYAFVWQFLMITEWAKYTTNSHKFMLIYFVCLWCIVFVEETVSCFISSKLFVKNSGKQITYSQKWRWLVSHKIAQNELASRIFS